MRVEFSTSDVDEPCRFDYWQDVICDAYLPISCDTPARDQFDGHIELQRLSRLHLSAISGSPQSVKRNKANIARDTEAYFLVSLQLSGQSNVIQSGRNAVLHYGDLTLYNTSEPYEIYCEDRVDQLIVQIPHTDLISRLPHANELSGLRIRGQTKLGSLIAGHIRQCADIIGQQDTLVQDFMQDTLIDLIAAGLADISSAPHELHHPEQLVLLQAVRIIRENLSDADLDRQLVAQAMGMSTRNLARAFARQECSIAGCIRDMRLDSIAEHLRNTRLANRSISEIACQQGIFNFQYLSTLFKKRFGLSPRDYRTKHSVGNY